MEQKIQLEGEVEALKVINENIKKEFDRVIKKDKTSQCDEIKAIKRQLDEVHKEENVNSAALKSPKLEIKD